MNEAEQDAWFYTREGERIGPVTLTDLRVLVHEGRLNPRLDLVWAQGMEGWKPAGEIEGLFEHRTKAPPQEQLAPPTDPCKPPKLEAPILRRSQENGCEGVRRRGFFVAVFLFPLAWRFIFPRLLGFLADPLGPQITNVLTVGGAFVPILVGIYYTILRLRNVGMSAWWYLGNFVPILNFWVGYRVFACPAGYDYHKKLDGVGVFLAIVYWLGTLLLILCIAAAVAIFLGAIGSPEIQAKIHEAVRIMQQQIPKQ